MCRVSTTCLILLPRYASHKVEIMECCPRCKTLLAGFNQIIYPGSAIRPCSVGQSIGGHCLIWNLDHYHPAAFAYCSICLFLLLTFRLKPLHLWGFLRVIATFGSTVSLLSLVSLGKMPVRNPISPKQSINRMPQLPPSMDSLDSHMRGIFLVLYFFSCHT